MKRIYYIILSLVFFAVSSCDNFMDVHKDFIKDGEIIYSPKTDSLSVITGKERLLFRTWLYKSPNVASIDIYWNGRADSLITKVSPSIGRDSFNIIVSNLPEKSYTFDIRTTDIFGHKSLWTSSFGNTYGNAYAATISNRRVNAVNLAETGGGLNGTVSFFAAAEGLVRSEVDYTKSDNSKAIVSLSAESSVATLPEAKAGSTFKFRSLFVPEKQSIDTFATAWAEYSVAFPSVYRYDKSSWAVLEVSDQTASDGGGMHMIINNNTGDYWHSKWDGGNVPCPHWAIIDMKTSKNIVRMETWRRNNNTDTKTVDFLLSDSPDPNGDWKKIGGIVFPNTTMNSITKDMDDKVTKGRYLKLFLPDSNRDPFVSIAEIWPYGGI